MWKHHVKAVQRLQMLQSQLSPWGVLWALFGGDDCVNAKRERPEVM